MNVLAAAVEVHLVGRVLNGLPLRESEIGLPDFVVCQYASPGASRSPFAGFVFTVTSRRSEDVLEALTKVPFFTFTFEGSVGAAAEPIVI